MSLGVALDDGLAIYQIVPQSAGKSLIGKWAGEGAQKASDEVILIGDTDVSTAKFPVEKINGNYWAVFKKANGKRDEHALHISGGDVLKKVTQVKETPGQGLYFGKGLAVITAKGLVMLEAGPKEKGGLTFRGHFVDKSGVPLEVSVTPN